MRITKSFVAPLTLIVIFGFVVKTYAQGNSPLAMIAAQLDSLISKVDAIAEAVNPPVSSDRVTLKTPLLESTGGGEQVICGLANVGSTTLTNIQITLRNDLGNFVPVALGTNPASLLPNQSVRFFTAPNPAQATRCVFSFDGGTANDVRANIEIRGNGTSADAR